MSLVYVTRVESVHDLVASIYFDAACVHELSEILILSANRFINSSTCSLLIVDKFWNNYCKHSTCQWYSQNTFILSLFPLTMAQCVTSSIHSYSQGYWYSALDQTLQFGQWVKGQSVPWRISEEDIVRKITLFVIFSTNIYQH